MTLSLAIYLIFIKLTSGAEILHLFHWMIKTTQSESIRFGCKNNNKATLHSNGFQSLESNDDMVSYYDTYLAF